MFLFLLAMELSTATAQRSDQYPFMLGRGYDLSVANLWDFSSGLTNKQILDLGDLPANCARADDSCVGISKTDLKQFASMAEAFSRFRTQTSISASLGFWDIAASLSVAFGTSGSSSWFSETYGTMGISLDVQRCHTLESSCLKPNNGDIKVLQQFTDAIKQSNHPDMSGCSVPAMEYWRTTVIEQFGTHMATQTRNGAMMRYQDITHYEGTDESQCMYFDICAGMKLAGFDPLSIDVKACSNTTACQGASSRSSSIEYECVAVGGHDTSGDPDQVPNQPGSQRMCNSQTSNATRAQFFEPTNEELNSDLTVVGMDFMPIDVLAYRYGASYTNTETIKKAREYHLCLALPRDVWQWSTDDCENGGDGKCKCIRRCENGGTLDETTCTCKCRGDAYHGWKGETCTETYGTCQPGVGTGNPNAARECATSNGHCASFYHGYQCKPTEVCCITDFYGTCCPFGSSCSCGVDHCSCVAPNDAFVNLLTKPVHPEPTAGTYIQNNGVSCRKKNKIKITKNGVQKTYKTFNLAKAKKTCDHLDECVGVMDSGCDGVGKYTLCKKADKPFKKKTGNCIHVKEE